MPIALRKSLTGDTESVFTIIEDREGGPCVARGTLQTMDPAQLRQELEQLRSYRVRPDRAKPISETFEQAAQQYKRMARRVGSIGEAWQDLCPPELLERTSIEGVSRGVLTICVTDAATRYELDRVLRSGLQREIIRAAPMSVSKVRIRLGAPRSR